VNGRPLCCGRTFLAAGMVNEARVEAQRTWHALRPYVERGIPVIGLEPSCLFSFRDEYGVLLKDSAPLGKNAFLFEEFLAREPGNLKFKDSARDVLLHGHCHQKAFDAMPAVEKVLGMVPGLKVTTVQTSCCGMAGSFGFEAEHYDVSMKMAELSLLPAVRNCGSSIVVADGTSCRHQIADGAGREAWHVARVLDSALTGLPAVPSPATP
jgi:Fe-S oxidoreductase